MIDRNRTRAWRFAGFLFACVLHAGASAQPWQDPTHHLSMDAPGGWSAMDAALLAKANAGVSHVTGRGFLGGFSAYPSDTLVFPYLLVQFKPYDALDESFRPVAKLDTTGRLELIARATRAFRIRLPLDAGTDLRAFQTRNESDNAELISLTQDGRFDFVGTIPLEDGSAELRYHSHGVLGRDGVAIVTLFADERFDELGPVIRGPMRTLAFAEGARYADLPDQPPTPEPQPQPDADPAQPTPEPGEPVASKPQAVAPPDPATTQAPPTNEQRADDARAGDSGTLMIVLGALGLALLVVAVVVALVTHRQHQARRERARARRERLGRAGK